MGAIRLFLALVVVASHLQAHWLVPQYSIYPPQRPMLGMNGGFAVVYFYAISGFLISMVLSKKYPVSFAGTRSFYQSRFVRIFSLYWPIAIIVLAARPGAWERFAQSSLGDQLTQLFLLGMDWRICFSPSGWSAAILSLEPAWTLSAELTFYLFAPFLLRSWPWTLAVLFGSLAIRGYFVATGHVGDVWTYHFLPSTFAFFLLGHVAREASERFTWLLHPLVCLPLLASAVIALMVGREPHWDSPRFWLSFLCFVSSLPGIFELTKNSRVLNSVGDLSYPVYLVHLPVLVALVDVSGGAARLKWVVSTLGASPAAVYGVFLSAVLFAAVVAHWALERPCARVMHAFFNMRAKMLANAPTSA